MNSDSSCDRTSEGVARAAGELLKTARSKKSDAWQVPP